MINLYSMQFGLLATLGSIGIQLSMLLTMLFFVRPSVDSCPVDPETNDSITNEQQNIWWFYVIFHGFTGILMIMRERNANADHNYIYNIIMQIINIVQIALLCYTMQIIFVDQTEIFATCLDGAIAMPLSYQKFSIWLTIEAGMIVAVVMTNAIFLALRAIFE